MITARRPRAVGVLGALGVLAATALAACVTPAAGQAGTSPTAAEHHRARGNTRIFAHVKKPGEPSFSLVVGKRVYVGTFDDVSGSDTSASKVFAYDQHGRLRRTYVVRGQKPGAAHGVQVAARDHAGRLYLLDQNPARVVVLNPKTGHQRTWATFADVKPCSGKQTTNCSHTVTDNAPEPDYAAWLPDGSLVVTDYAQQLVWHIAAHDHGVRKAKVWLNDARLDGEMFGPAGIVLAPKHTSLLMTVATGGITSPDPKNNPSEGRLYRIVLGRHDRPVKLVRLWDSKAGEAPDGFAISRHHEHLYIAMAGPTGNSMVEIVRTKSGAWKRVLQVDKSVDGVRWDTATSVAFLGTDVLVTNQAYFDDDSANWALFNVAVGEHGHSIYVPKRAGR